MANFTAEERETSPSAGAKPGEGPPICPTPFLPNAIDNVAMTFYLHRHKTHTLKDCFRVGYFNPVREMLAQQLRSGGEAFIKLVLGAREDGFTICDLHVLDGQNGGGFSQHWTALRLRAVLWAGLVSEQNASIGA